MLSLSLRIIMNYIFFIILDYISYGSKSFLNYTYIFRVAGLKASWILYFRLLFWKLPEFYISCYWSVSFLNYIFHRWLFQFVSVMNYNLYRLKEWRNICSNIYIYIYIYIIRNLFIHFLKNIYRYIWYKKYIIKKYLFCCYWQRNKKKTRFVVGLRRVNWIRFPESICIAD